MPKFFSDGALPRTPLGELTMLPRPTSQQERGHPSPYPTSLGTDPPSVLAIRPQNSSQIYAYGINERVRSYQTAITSSCLLSPSLKTVWDWTEAYSRPRQELHSETGLSWVGCNLNSTQTSGNESSLTAAYDDPVTYTARPSCIVHMWRLGDPGQSFALQADVAGVDGAVFLWTQFETVQYRCRIVRETLWGVKTLRTQDTSDPRHFGTSAEVSTRHFGTSTELSGHFGTSAKTTWGTLRH